MKIQYLMIAGLLAFAVHGADKKTERNTDATAAFQRLKLLVGEWEAAEGKGHLSYELTGAGTALVEREVADKRPSMMTVYHLDGGRLLLTHYCMVGNQPRMLARSFNAETGELVFDFLDATNLASPGAGHMHSVRIHFADNDHFASDWQYFEDGKPKFTETAQYTRVR